ncbi:MAG: peptidoglycan-binding domain-containing protein [Rhizobiaceae bacterium]|nr:peptidoglycan-binding domain-containing protein [Rhizobiaceae bacterium]
MSAAPTAVITCDNDACSETRLSLEILAQLAADAFETMNWARREGMKRPQQIEETVKAFEVTLGYRPDPQEESLGLGDSGDAVRRLQTRLHTLGYEISKSGDYDTATAEAVAQFQKDLGLACDGVADRATRDRAAEMARLNIAGH